MGYSIEEKLRVLNIMISQKSLMYENREKSESDSSKRDERGEGLWSRKLKNRIHGLKTVRHSSYGEGPTLDFLLRGRPMPLEQAKLGKQNPKGTLKLAGSKTSLAKELDDCFPSFHKGVERKSGPYGSSLAALPVGYLEKVQQFPVEEHMMFGKSRAQSLLLKGSWNELSNDKAQGEAFPVYPSFINGDGNVKSDKLKIEETSDLKVNDWFFHSEYRAKPSQEKVGAISIQNGATDTAALRSSRNYAKSEGTESDSSEQIDEDENPFMRSKLAYHHVVLHGSVTKSGPAPKKAKVPKKDNSQPLDRGSHSSMKMSDLSEHPCTPEVENYSLKGNQKVKKKKLKEDVTYDERDDNDYVHTHSMQQLDTLLRKPRKRNLEDEMGSTKPPLAEMGAADVELEPSLQKKLFALITPKVHSGFSFSIIHLLSAARMAMITLLPEDSLEVGKHFDKSDGRQKLREEHDRKQEGTYGVHLYENLDINKSGHSMQLNVPSLTVQEIVNRVRSNPGERGLTGMGRVRVPGLHVGQKDGSQLCSMKNQPKVGPGLIQFLIVHQIMKPLKKLTSPEAWGLPHKMLVKLVDSFANWLKSGQETLQQFGSLHSPPSSLMQFNSDEKERFRDLRAQRSLTTISSISKEVRAYFHIKEVLRYSIPDRTFSYTATDGKKSIVAPLRRCSGKPPSKARDHFMLKHNRPPHVTILCLVRNAAARLPGSIGTRSDVCTLIRDSRYIVEDVFDAQVNQFVSGALDRLHYERDPCVQFDGEKKLWVYLHREREEEDFEDDGTSSTKEAGEPLEQATVTVAYHGAGEQTGFDLSSDLNVEPSCVGED
ncbi:hypothetical protein Acr_26g0012280 [Actinidia rufa]|uniref:Nuclear factor related to kappa-B-binding protein second winged helix domain-containing protein n=1 Tax=Actinidia rufa TaxID=165716 RepID=A0A7J0H4H3_9ERIC|nr:hypothetical protein Acr_26g0012280 [Actinidia rufa]